MEVEFQNRPQNILHSDEGKKKSKVEQIIYESFCVLLLQIA